MFYAETRSHGFDWLVQNDVDKDNMASVNDANHKWVELALWWIDFWAYTHPILQKHSIWLERISDKIQL